MEPCKATCQLRDRPPLLIGGILYFQILKPCAINVATGFKVLLKELGHREDSTGYCLYYIKTLCTIAGRKGPPEGEVDDIFVKFQHRAKNLDHVVIDDWQKLTNALQYRETDREDIPKIIFGF
jgi:hypothetical protein